MKPKLILFILHFAIQANNAYIFPGFGLGLIMSGAIRVHDDMLLAAGKCIYKQVFAESPSEMRPENRVEYVIIFFTLLYFLAWYSGSSVISSNSRAL